MMILKVFCCPDQIKWFRLRKSSVSRVPFSFSEACGNVVQESVYRRRDYDEGSVEDLGIEASVLDWVQPPGYEHDNVNTLTTLYANADRTSFFLMTPWYSGAPGRLRCTHLG